MGAFDELVEGIRSIRAHGLRSALAALGIAIGVAALVSLLSLTAGARGGESQRIQPLAERPAAGRPPGFPGELRPFGLAMGAMAVVSLMIGGAGAASVVLLSVAERGREIAVRRALGASHRAIVVHFMAETVLLSAAGGLIGVAAGLALAVGARRAVGWETAISGGAPVAGFAVAILIGVAFGAYPARRAARVDPIAELRLQ